MVVDLRHAVKDANAQIPPLSWDYWLWGAEPPFIKTAIVSCDRGHVGTAAPAIHRIAADGTLSPSWVCPHVNAQKQPDCPWHVFARLVGWGAG